MTSNCKKMKAQCLDTDKISTLPQNIIENILTLVPFKEAVRTSILSRNWRFCWTTIPNLVFDDKLVEVPSDCDEFKKLKFVNVILNVLILHRGPILEFCLNAGEHEVDSEFDPIMNHLSKSISMEKIVLEMSSYCSYKLPSSFFSLQGLELLELTNCYVDPPLTFNGFSRLTSMHFHHVKITSKILQHFLSSCPLLTEVILDGSGDDADFEGGKTFTFAELLKCVPLIEALAISEFYMRYLVAGGMLQKLPTLVHLLDLVLVVSLAEQDDISSALCLMRSSPNLEAITFMLHAKWYAPRVSMNLIDFQDYSNFKLDHLEELEMQNFRNVGLELEFVKLVMGKSTVLKKVRIQLAYGLSDEEELKIHRDLIQLPFPRASPSAITIIERPKY